MGVHTCIFQSKWYTNTSDLLVLVGDLHSWPIGVQCIEEGEGLALVFTVFGRKTLALMPVTPGGGNLNYRHNGMPYVHTRCLNLCFNVFLVQFRYCFPIIE